MKYFWIFITIFSTLAFASSSAAQTANEEARRSHILPLIADGGGLQSSLLITNTSRLTNPNNQCILNLEGPSIDASRFQESANVRWDGSMALLDFSGSVSHLSILSSSNQPVTLGHATLDCDAPVVAQTLFILNTAEGIAGMTSIPSSQSAAKFGVPLLPQFGSLFLTYSNPSPTDAICELEIDNGSEIIMDSERIFVPAYSTGGNFLDTPSGFGDGIAIISCDRQLVIVGLAVSEDLALAALSPAIFSLNPVALSEPVISVVAGPAVTEGGNARFTITSSTAPADDLQVNISIVQEGAFVGAANLGTSTVRLAAGQNSASYNISTIDDDVDETDGAVTLSVETGVGYMVSASADSARVAVADNDEPETETPTPDEIEVLEGLTVSSGSVQYLFFNAGTCIVLSGSINGVVYSVHSSRWETRNDSNSAWTEIPGTVQEGGICSYSPTEAGEYRIIVDISIDGQRGTFTGENTITI